MPRRSTSVLMSVDPPPLSEIERELLLESFPRPAYELVAIEHGTVILVHVPSGQPWRVGREPNRKPKTGIDTFARKAVDTEGRAVASGVVAIDIFTGEKV